jgi:hypothetical protein
MSTSPNANDSTETLQIFPAGSAEARYLAAFASYCADVAEAFRFDVLSEYPQGAKHLVISMWLEEKRLVAELIRDKAKAMADGDKRSVFYGSYLFWCDALSTLKWLTSQLNHAKERH